MSRELELLDQSLGGDMRVDVLRTVFDSRERFNTAVTAMLHAGDLHLRNVDGEEHRTGSGCTSWNCHRQEESCFRLPTLGLGGSHDFHRESPPHTFQLACAAGDDSGGGDWHPIGLGFESSSGRTPGSPPLPDRCQLHRSRTETAASPLAMAGSNRPSVSFRWPRRRQRMTSPGCSGCFPKPGSSCSRKTSFGFVKRSSIQNPKSAYSPR